ncbi:MAG: phosphopentomutase [Proteobacteria bacterium]|nr:phosphopentomutase [Pseudomonadota bacterium]
MPRTLVIVLDSVGIGGAPDAAAYNDSGADTLGHIAEACAEGRGDRAGLRSGPLSLPHLVATGLGVASRSATGRVPPGLDGPHRTGLAGSAIETSKGKDTPSGHWEIAGVPVTFDWGYFPETVPAFPAPLIADFLKESGLGGTLANCHASGTEVIEDFGEEHLKTGWPILYTSVDSVLQVAAHEEAFGLERLYEICRILRRLTLPLNIGRVIARPFLGARRGDFRRTPNRKDWAIEPAGETLFDRLDAAGRQVVSVGKTGDIFAHRATGREVKGAGNMANLDLALAEFAKLPDGGLIFANLVDFDSEYGHRRDVPGYAACLEQFDARMPEIIAALKPGDLCLITADHGNDPTWRGTDHTREQVPVLMFGPGLAARAVGQRASFADMAQSVLVHQGLPPGPCGTSLL